MAKMGLQFGLESGQYCKRQNRWIFVVNNIIGDEKNAINALPPSKAARPHLTFTEIPVRHLIEDVAIPGKPDWKPITVTVFDLKKNENKLWEWIKNLYEPKDGIFRPPNTEKGPQVGFIRECSLRMLDGCGRTVESWIFEDCWPQQLNFQTLDYAQADVLMAEITIRYARAYIEQDAAGDGLGAGA